MRYVALAMDYDNTLAHHGRTPEAAVLAIDRLRISGRRVILVTGRRLDDLLTVCPGLQYALRRLGLSFHEVVGVGDAENDHSFLQRCECAVAVANAIPSIKEAAAFVTERENGEGVTEVIDELIATDLGRLEGKVPQNLVLLGRRGDGTEVRVPPYGRNLLIAGPSGSGKSTFATGLIERLMGQTYRLCVVDPEGDYGTLQDVVSLGNQRRAAIVNEVLSILEDPTISLSVNLLGIPLADRPRFFAELVPNLQAMHAISSARWRASSEGATSAPRRAAGSPTTWWGPATPCRSNRGPGRVCPFSRCGYAS